MMRTRIRTLLTAAGLAAVLVTAPAAPALAQLVWVPKGPSPGLGDFNTLINEPDSPFGGALEAVVAHPTNPNILWVGSVNGGIFRTDNALSIEPTWVAQTADQPSLSISALERDPTDPSHNTLLAAVGNRSSFFDGGTLTGILKTPNGGVTWNPLSPSLAGRDVSGLAPRGGIVVAAVDGPGTSCATVGIWRSTNSGLNFNQISNGAGLPCGFARDLASDPTNNARLFAPITGTPGANDDGLYRSTNTGATWTQVGSGSVLDAALESAPREVNVAVGRGGGAAANVFVAVCQEGKLSGLFHSANAGINWVSLDLPMTNESGTNFGIHPGGQCGLHLSLVADPVDPSVVYVGGDRQPAANEGVGGSNFPNSLGATSYAGRLFKVDADLPAGSQATPITNCPTPFPGCKGSRRTVGNTAPHADSREMVFNASGQLIETDDGGVYRHTNPRGTNGNWVSSIGNLSAVEQHSSSYDTLSNIIVSGNQDNGLSEQVTTPSTSWVQVIAGDGGDTAVAQNDPVVGRSTRYMSNQNFGFRQRRVYDANNVLQSQAVPSLTPLGGSPNLMPVFVTPIAVNAANPTRMIISGSNGTFESFDRLDSITRRSPSKVNDAGRGPIAYGVASNHNVLYIGVENAVLVRDLAHPDPLTITFPGGGFDTDFINDVVMDPDTVGSTAFAVDRNTVYGTTNPFLGWVNITGNLFTVNPQAGTINTVTYVNQGGDRVVIGTNTGVFAATQASGFATWAKLGTGLPNTPVYDLEYDPQNNLLVAGTLGRGAWVLGLDPNCPWERIFSNTTLNTAQTRNAEAILQLGPDLTASNFTGITMVAGGQVIVNDDVVLGGTFTASLGPCP